MSKPNAKGRIDKPRFIRLFNSTFDCPAYRALAPNARALLWELIRCHNGRNNGELFLAYRDAEMLMGVANDATVYRAFQDLVEHGFIASVRPGSFSLKGGKAST